MLVRMTQHELDRDEAQEGSDLIPALTNQQIIEFQEAYREDSSEELSFENARIMASRFLSVIELVYRSRPSQATPATPGEYPAPLDTQPAPQACEGQ